jgi:cell division topological specificity factor
MNLLTLFRKTNSAPVARERLQVLLAHERLVTGGSDLVATLQEEILAVIAKHVTVDRDKVQIKLDRGATVSMLEIDVEVPALTELKAAANG